VLDAVALAGERDEYVDAALFVVTLVALSQAVPALVALWLLRRGRAVAALGTSGVAAFVPGVMILYLTITSAALSGAVVVVLIFAAALVAIGLHQLRVRKQHAG